MRGEVNWVKNEEAGGGKERTDPNVPAESVKCVVKKNA
jgi:hypothetical protein